MLLSFAKLLLELESGKRIDFSESDQPESRFGALCKRIYEIGKEGLGLYADAVSGCLNLHNQYLKRTPSDDEDPREAIRQMIQERIIKRLEHALNPPTAAGGKHQREDLYADRNTEAKKPRTQPPQLTRATPTNTLLSRPPR